MRHGIDLTIVTQRSLVVGAPDDRLLMKCLKERDLRVRLAAWDDPAVDWGASAVTVIRSAWNYYQEPSLWRMWLAAATRVTRIHNELSLLTWNADKGYLLDLLQRGIRCVPTVLIPSEAAADAWKLLRKLGWIDIVIKPAVGASAFGVRRFHTRRHSADAQVHVSNLAARGSVLVQPYQSKIESERERSLVFLGGTLSHAFSKPGFSTVADGTTGICLHEPTADECSLGAAALSALPSVPLYARVDLVSDACGPLLMELELTEPDLGLRVCTRGLRRFSDLCERLVETE